MKASCRGTRRALVVCAAALLAIGCSREEKEANQRSPATEEAAHLGEAPAVAPASEKSVAEKAAALDCNAASWQKAGTSGEKSAGTAGPDPARAAWLDRAMAAVSQDESNYVFVARRPESPDPSKVVCWQAAGRLSDLTGETTDARPARLLWCSFAGQTRALTVFDEEGAAPDKKAKGNEPPGPPGECYAACGSGCSGACQEIPVGCAPAPDGQTSPAFACLALVDPPDKLPRFPWLPSDEGAPRCVDPRRHASRAPAACSATVHRFAPDGLVATAGRVKACTAAACCGHHDECTRAHKSPLGAAFWKCHWYGERKCGGPWAIAGRPDRTDWTLRLFNLAGQPISGREWTGGPLEVGHCTWKGGEPTWQPPPALAESYTCAVDDQEH